MSNSYDPATDGSMGMRDGAQILANAAENIYRQQEALKNTFPSFVSQYFTSIWNSDISLSRLIFKVLWAIPIILSSLLRLSVSFLSFIPQAVISFLIVPFHLISCIPGAFRLFFRLTFDQILASIGSTALLGGLFTSLLIYRSTTVGQGVNALYSFLLWIPIYSVGLIILSNTGPLRTLFYTLAGFSRSSPWSAVFVFLFVWKFLKIVVHLFSYTCLTGYRLPPANPTVLPSDVTVIIPSVSDFGEEFILTVQTVLANHPAKVIISTVGASKLLHARRVAEEIMRSNRLPGRTIEVVTINEANKRAQCVHASIQVKTDIIAYADDHVIWPRTFLQSVLAEFEEPSVGIVGTVKQVIRDPGKNWSDSIRNFIACIYLERHNFEMTATYNLDGGVWVISGRTCLIRSDIVQTLEFRQKFLSETFLGIGPINCDDDNFITRYMINHGFKTVFHNRPEAMILTTLGTSGGWPKFWQQLLRWARSIWRSHSKTVFVDGKCWKAFPWTSYAMFLSGLTNISIIYDPFLFISLYNSKFYNPNGHVGAYLAWVLLLSKIVKSWHFYARNTDDLWWCVPVGWFFGYFHGFVRLVALVTCWDTAWGGRDLSAVAPKTNQRTLVS